VLHALAASAPADAIEIARALSDRPGLAVLASASAAADRGRFSYVAADPDGASAQLDPFEGSPASAPGPLAGAPRFFGVLPYEAARARMERLAWVPGERRPEPLVRSVAWLRYPAVLVIDHERGTVTAVGASISACRDLCRRAESGAARAPDDASFTFAAADTEDPELHGARVRRAIELIHAGDLYQVNLARRIRLALRAQGGASISEAALAWFRSFLARAPTPFGALCVTARGEIVASSSPELFLDASAGESPDGFGELVTEPIKGTRPRGRDAAEDAALAEALASDDKERAELAMIVDVERNDLSRVAVRGSVAVDGPPRVVTLRTVHHRVARVRARARPDACRREVLEAMLPSGSVTGAPRVRAMEVIASLEPMRRGLYTGALGYAAHDGSMRLAMAIRTAVFDAAGDGEYLVGGGIVADSDPEREVEETRWKARQLGELDRM
jgi:anthranilate/para-aminobenzoate synthase component I